MLPRLFEYNDSWRLMDLPVLEGEPPEGFYLHRAFEAPGIIRRWAGRYYSRNQDGSKLFEYRRVGELEWPDRPRPKIEPRRS